MDSLERLAEYFHRFALMEVKASSPLYRRLASAIAGDPDLIALAGHAPPGPTPNLFLAAVHYLLLKGAPHPDPCGRQAPALQDSGCRGNDEARRGNLDPRARLDASIPDRSPGHAFVRMTKRERRNHHGLAKPA